MTLRIEGAGVSFSTRAFRASHSRETESSYSGVRTQKTSAFSDFTKGYEAMQQERWDDQATDTMRAGSSVADFYQSTSFASTVSPLFTSDLQASLFPSQYSAALTGHVSVQNLSKLNGYASAPVTRFNHPMDISTHSLSFTMRESVPLTMRWFQNSSSLLDNAPSELDQQSVVSPLSSPQLSALEKELEDTQQFLKNERMKLKQLDLQDGGFAEKTSTLTDPIPLPSDSHDAFTQSFPAELGQVKVLSSQKDGTLLLASSRSDSPAVSFMLYNPHTGQYTQPNIELFEAICASSRETDQDLPSGWAKNYVFDRELFLRLTSPIRTELEPDTITDANISDIQQRMDSHFESHRLETSSSLAAPVIAHRNFLTTMSHALVG